MEELSTNSYDTTQYIVIKLGVEQYGIDIQNIDNIVRMQHITRVPKVADYVKGVINLRGEVIPVLSLRLKMGFEEDEFTKDSRIIILKLEQHGTLGVIVDEVKEVVTLENSAVEKFTYDSKEERNGSLIGVGKSNGQLISLLDMSIVVAEKEKE